MHITKAFGQYLLIAFPTSFIIKEFLPTKSSLFISGRRCSPAVTITTSAFFIEEKLFDPLILELKPSIVDDCERSKAFPWENL